MGMLPGPIADVPDEWDPDMLDCWTVFALEDTFWSVTVAIVKGDTRGRE